MDIIKIEIIISNTFLQPLIKLLEEASVQGYTAIEIVRGKGIKQGEHLSEGLLPTSRRTLLFTLTTAKNSKQIMKKVQPFLDHRGGILMMHPIAYASGLN